MKSARNQQSIDSKKFLFIVASWTIAGALLSIYDHYLLVSHLSEGYGEGSFFLKALITNSLAGFIGGLMGGSLLVYVVNKRFRSEPYYKSVLIVSVAFVVAILIISLSLAWLQVSVLYGGLSSAEGYRTFLELIYTTEHVKNIIFWAFMVAITQMGLQINDKFGQGLLWSMITGKYLLPRSEDRIFMFLDLKGSTAIAERLGNEVYHLFLRDLFADITDPILANGGEIYQYVGDEIVISWKTGDGISGNNCIRCFFDIRETLITLQEKYRYRYDLLPTFKAGIHYGKVIAGEVGIIKRDITYSGDTLNTAARLQAMCNEHQSSLLISGALANLLTLEAFKTKSLGRLPVRGKLEAVEILSVDL
ncbi:MAG: adenylate/guanylate cyclase domain-containing protein [Cyclobacteriaceae bacterium]